MSKKYSSRKSAQRAAKRSGGYAVRRDRFGRFSKRGRTWTIIPKRRKPVPPPPLPPPGEREWQIKIDYTKSKGPKGARPVLIDMVIKSKKSLSRNEAELVMRNAMNGIPPAKGIRIDAINWTRKGKSKSGSTADLAQFNTLIDSNAEFRIERKE